MSTNNLSTWLKYANLQMAAEAFLIDDQGRQLFSGPLLEAALIKGNKHASKFTETQAKDFATRYKVIAHIPNTGSGFSGTLFQDQNTKEYTLSFRSTEFVEDVIADSVGTNEGISDNGWAFGQIADMEDWWKTLQTSVPDLKSKGFVVTGYSLGGHLATAFAQLRAEENNGTPPAYLQHVYTYNGAGTGAIGTGAIDSGLTLSDVMKLFIDVWKNGVEPDWISDTRDTPESLSQRDIINNAAAASLKKVQDEAAKVTGYVSGVSGDGTTPVTPRLGYFADYRFHYAMSVAGQWTSGASIWANTNYSAVFDSSKAKTGGMMFADSFMTELLGSGISAVATGGLRHTATRTEIKIEDQPYQRGTPLRTYPGPGGIAPRLTNQYGLNDFGDTHSLVLLVDSLAIMDTLARLDTGIKQSTAEAILKAASATQRDTVPGSQGKAEGDVLESVLDALVQTFTYADPKLRDGKAKNQDSLNIGGTWADGTLRTNFYKQLDTLQKSQAFKDLADKVTVELPDTGLLPTTARTDFASLLTLLTLSPFALKAKPGNEATVESVLGGVWQNEYADWQADQALTPAQLKDGQGNYTQQFLDDRSAFLSWIKLANINNIQAAAGKTVIDGGKYGYSGSRNWEFTQLDSNAGLNRTTFECHSGQTTVSP